MLKIKFILPSPQPIDLQDPQHTPQPQALPLPLPLSQQAKQTQGVITRKSSWPLSSALKPDMKTTAVCVVGCGAKTGVSNVTVTHAVTSGGESQSNQRNQTWNYHLLCLDGIAQT